MEPEDPVLAITVSSLHVTQHVICFSQSTYSAIVQKSKPILNTPSGTVHKITVIFPNRPGLCSLGCMVEHSRGACKLVCGLFPLGHTAQIPKGLNHTVRTELCAPKNLKKKVPLKCKFSLHTVFKFLKYCAWHVLNTHCLQQP